MYPDFYSVPDYLKINDSKKTISLIRLFHFDLFGMLNDDLFREGWALYQEGIIWLYVHRHH